MEKGDYESKNQSKEKSNICDVHAPWGPGHASPRTHNRLEAVEVCVCRVCMLCICARCIQPRPVHVFVCATLDSSSKVCVFSA